MAYTFKTNIANKANFGGTRATSAIKYIVIHYTGNDGDKDENNGKYFANNIVKASAHYFVDGDSVTQSVPDGSVAWAVGGGLQGSGGHTYHKKCTNTNSISIELCDEVRDGKFYPSAKTIENALILTKELMRKYGIPKANVIRHYDVTGKLCPAYWCGSDSKDALWKSEFLNRIDGTATASKTETVAKPSTGYTLKDFIKEVQSAIGAAVDGIAGKETLSKTVTVSATINRRHPVVKPLQKRLNALGFNCGTVDGIAGAKFTAAVIAYQKSKNSTQDGEITARHRTWQHLLEII